MVLSEQDRSDLGFNTTTTSHIRFPSDCSLNSRGTFTEYEWTDYCPEVFRNLQCFERIDPDDYLQSICGRETIRLLFPQKRNSPHTFSSYDEKFIFKTLSKPEMKVILDMLPNYYNHVQKHRNTLLTKFFGLHVVKPSNGPKVRFIVMANILQSDVSIHKTFNLKVSSQNRTISKTGAEEDMNFSFYLDTPTRNQFLGQLKHDCNFLEDEGIMDYTMLLGMHVCPAPFESVIKNHNSSAQAAGSDDGKSSSDSPKLSESDADLDSVSVTDSESSWQTEPDVKFGVKMPAHVFDTRRKETRSTASHRAAGKENNKVFLNFGIVDIIQGNSMLKRLENAFKNLHYDSQSTPAVNPRAYSAHFQELIHSVFPGKKSSDNF